MRGRKNFISGSILAVLITVFIAPSAHAQVVSPRVCDPGNDGYSESFTLIHVPAPENRVYGAGGGTLSYAATESYGVTGTLSTTAEADAGVVFAHVSASVGVSVALSKTVSNTVGYTYTVPADVAQGWIEMGSAGYTIDWVKGTYTSPCEFHQTDGGTIVGATANKSFIHS